MGVEGRPLFTHPLAVWDHLMRPRAYGEAKWAQKQKMREASVGTNNGGLQTHHPQDRTPAKQRCPAKAGAKSSARHYATDFYAKPVVELGSRRGSRFMEGEISDAKDTARGRTTRCSNRSFLVNYLVAAFLQEGENVIMTTHGSQIKGKCAMCMC